jgi:phosphoribosylanthranilate isomerase
VDAGADALGFMFFEQSKRNIPPDHAAEIIAHVPPHVLKVGVFVNASEEVIRNAIDGSGIDALQLHGEESPEFCSRFNSLKVVKAFRVRDRSVLDDCKRYSDCAWLLDSYVAGERGGSGVTFDWDVAREAAALSNRVILAGGLKPETVADAVRRVRPFAVDVSSGVESSPGKKDAAKVRDFIRAAKSVG